MLLICSAILCCQNPRMVGSAGQVNRGPCHWIYASAAARAVGQKDVSDYAFDPIATASPTSAARACHHV